MDQATPSHQTVLRNLREYGKGSYLDRRLGLCVGRDREKTAPTRGISLHFTTDPFFYFIRENPLNQALAVTRIKKKVSMQPKQLDLFILFTGHTS